MTHSVIDLVSARQRVSTLSRIGLCLWVSALLWANCRALAADALDEPVRIDIPRGTPLDLALIQLAQAITDQTGMHVMLASNSVGQQTTEGLGGTLPASEALAKLLTGSGLSYQRHENTVTIRRLPKLEAASNDAFRTSQADGGSLGSADGNSSEEKSGSRESAANPEGLQVQEVVVTAQKREERLQDVPISISVLNGDDLDSSVNQGITEALSKVPGVSAYEGYSGTAVIGIRGVSVGGIENGSSPVAYYLDSVPLGFARHNLTPDASAYDLDRVEVLRGPQGTLYGASALNGVVRVLTKDADVTAFDFKARTSTSTTESGAESYRGDLAVNVPIVENKLAVRAVIGYQGLGGWIDKPNVVGESHNNVNDGIVRTARLKVQAQATDNLSIGVSVWRSEADFGAPSFSSEAGIQTTMTPQPNSTDYSTYGLKADYDLAALSISSITSYADFRNASDLALEVVGLPPGPDSILFIDQSAKVFSQELLLRSQLSGDWRWAAGVFYRHAEDRRFATLPVAWTAPYENFDVSESAAIFGEVGRQFLEDRLELTVGLRQFHDDVATKPRSVFFSENDGLLVDQSFSFNATTPRVVLTWKPDADLTVYGSYAQGFRSGIGQVPQVTIVAPNIPPARPDRLNNYEVGAKGHLWNRRVAFDTALYYVDWKETQQVVIVDLGDGVTSGALVNSSGASGVGADLAVTIQPLEGLEVGGTFSWNDLALDRDVFSGGLLLYRKGERINESAKYTAGITADYTFPFGGSGWKGRLVASGHYTSNLEAQYLIGTSRVRYRGDNILLARTSFSIESSRHWTGTLFVDNINNEKGAVTPSDIAELSRRARPRTVGLQLEYRL